MSDKKQINDELLAHYLDGVTTEAENEVIKECLASDDDIFDEVLLLSQELAFQEAEMTTETKKQSVYSKSILQKDNLDDDIRYLIAGHGKQAIAAATIDLSETCAIQAQQIILQNYGINVSITELTNVAIENGWFIEHQGSPLDFVGELLNYYNIAAVQMRNANIYHLMHELSQGHKIIVGVDANELEQSELWGKYDDTMFGEEVNHVLLVGGIDTTNPEDVQIVLTDPTKEDRQKSYPAKQFLEAWEDSGFFMVATTTPAPLTLNPEMQNFDYEIGHVKKFADFAYTEIVKRLADDGYIQNKDNKYRRKTFYITAIFAVALLIALWLIRYLSPIDMQILVLENTDYQIPNMPLETAELRVSYSSMQPQLFNLTDKNQTAFLNNIHHKYKRDKVHIIFRAEGYQTIDTTVKIDKQVDLYIRRDNSLSLVFGSIIDGKTGRPVEGVEVSIQDLKTATDASGKFGLNIPFSKQKKAQRLQAYKHGYQLWTGTYQPSQTNAWEIVILPEE